MARATVSRGLGRAPLRTATLLALCATLLASCGLPSLPPLPWQQSRQQPAPLPDAQQVAHITVAGGAIADPLDPFYLGDPRSAAAYVLPLVYSGLLTLDANHHIAPGLAASYAVSADGLTYTFHLRADARFADGSPITAVDVASSLNLSMSPCSIYGRFVFSAVKDQPRFVAQNCANPQVDPLAITAQPGQPLLPSLVGDALLAPDQQTLVILLSRPDGALPAKLVEPFNAIVETSLVTRYRGGWTQHLADNGGQGTSGMYAVSQQSQATDGDILLTLTRAPGYWGARPRLRQLIVDLARPGAPGVIVVATGDITLVAGTSPDAPQNAAVPIGSLAYVTPGFHQALARDEGYLLLDPAAPELSNLQLRQALALALNKTALAAISGGVATDHLIPPHTSDYADALSGPIATAPLGGDVARAQGLWLSYVQVHCRGVASLCPTITLYYQIADMIGADPYQQAFDQMVARQWQAALPGIRVKLASTGGGLLTPLSFVSHTSYFNWDEDYPDPQDWLAMFTDVSNAYQPLVDDAQANALVAQAEATPNTTARLALYQQAENTLLNDAVVIPIAQEQDTWAAKPTVVNFPANPAPWIAPDAWARIYLSAPGSHG